MKAEDLQLKHRVDIATIIVAGIKNGVSIATILDQVSVMPGGPRSKTSLYKIYRSDIVNAKADIQSKLGAKAMEMALAGDVKMLDLALRSKAGWSPSQTVVESESDEADENTTAIDDLLTLLKIKQAKPTEDAEDE